MIEKKLRKIRFFKYLKLSLVSGFISLGIGCIINTYSTPFIMSDFIKITLNAFCIAFATPFILLIAYDGLQYNRIFKRLHFLLQMLIGIILFLVIIVTAYSSFFLLFFGSTQMLLVNIQGAIFFGSVIALLLMSVSTFSEFLGKGFFTNLIKGFYQKVRVEKAVIMFVDLKNSTRMGETLKPNVFFSLLNDFLRIIDMCCTYYRGELYKYMGDGAILVWNVSPAGLSNVLDFITGFREEMAEKTASFKSTYGMEISYTAGVHSGNVIKGGLGSDKREMGIWGDTINTASRIQGICKQYNVSFLMSEDFLKDVESIIPEKAGNLSPYSVGETVLRGKAGMHKLFTV